MAKKKSKIREQVRIQQEQARYRKMYFEKLQYYCDMYGGKGTLALVPQKILDALYKIRIHPLKIVLDANSHINPNSHKYVHKLLYSVMHNMQVTIGNDLPDVRLDDFTIFCRSIIVLISINEDIQEPWAIEFNKRLACLSIDDVSFEASREELNLLRSVGLMLSNIQTGIVWLDYNLTISETTGADNIAVLYFKKPALKYFKFPDGSRPAFRVSWYFIIDKFVDVSIKSSLWNSDTPFVDLQLAIYIQSHALQRLWERIDVYPHSEVQVNMIISLVNPVIIRTGKNTGLIEYRINEHKYGYLVCEYIDGDILIKTFLFLTNNGTPEGQKLNELTGLNKEDKKYLAIDRISSFIASNIEQNELLKKLFMECGCESLVHAAEHLQFEKEKFSRLEVSNLIAEYIKNEPVPVFENEVV